MTKTNQLLRQVRILNPELGIDKVTDVLVVENKIKQIEPQIELDNKSIQIIDGEELVFAPALVDLYSSSGEPGYEERETLLSLAQVAQAGGFKRVGILPNTNPTIDNLNMVSWLKNQTRNYDTKFDVWGSLTHNLAGEKIAPLAQLAEAGVVGFTDNCPHQNLQLVRKLLEYAQPFNLPVALVANNLELSSCGVVRESQNSLSLGLQGNPEIAESVAIASILEIASFTKTPIHLMRVSTARGVELIKQAKENGISVTASVTWHHLLLNEEITCSYNPNLRFEPPLGREKDRLSLLAGIKNGIIDAIAIDHQPYTYEEKTVAFALAPAGSIGLELALPLLWQHLVSTESLSALQLWQSLSIKPLKCLNQPSIKLEVGADVADFILFSPQQKWQLTPSQLKSLSSNTYWLNQEIQGKVISQLTVKS